MHPSMCYTLSWLLIFFSIPMEFHKCVNIRIWGNLNLFTCQGHSNLALELIVSYFIWDVSCNFTSTLGMVVHASISNLQVQENCCKFKPAWAIWRDRGLQSSQKSQIQTQITSIIFNLSHRGDGWRVVSPKRYSGWKIALYHFDFCLYDVCIWLNPGFGQANFIYCYWTTSLAWILGFCIITDS